MQPFILIIFPALALAASSPSASLSACIVGNQCAQAGYGCTQTSSCGGLCLTSQTFPLVIHCTIGNNGPCPTGSTRTPTEYCTAGITAPCGGQCITTSAPPPGTANLPTIPCEVGPSSSCPTNAFCTPTEACIGVCLGTGTAPLTGTSTPRSTTPTSTSTSPSFTLSIHPFTPTTTFSPLPSCTIGGDASCSYGSVCTPLANCYGFCHSGISSPTTLPTATNPAPPPYTTASKACFIGRPVYDGGCPTHEYCLPTQTCPGLWINTLPLPPGTTMTLPTTPGPSSSSVKLTSMATLSGPTATRSGTCGWMYIPCWNGYQCVNSYGKKCGLGDSGHCVLDQQKKHRFLAGRYLNDGLQ